MIICKLVSEKTEKMHIWVIRVDFRLVDFIVQITNPFRNILIAHL